MNNKEVQGKSCPVCGVFYTERGMHECDKEKVFLENARKIFNNGGDCSVIRCKKCPFNSNDDVCKYYNNLPTALEKARKYIEEHGKMSDKEILTEELAYRIYDDIPNIHENCSFNNFLNQLKGAGYIEKSELEILREEFNSYRLNKPVDRMVVERYVAELEKEIERLKSER